MQRTLYLAGALALGVIPAIGALAATPLISSAEAGPYTGCHVGAVGSYNAATVEDTFGAEGYGIAGVAGCDLQVDRFVVGAWGEYGTRTFDWSGIDVDAKGWAAGGRAGIVVTNTLLYGLVGYTDLEAEADYLGSIDLTGIVLGGGAEVDLGRNFFARLEYQHLDLETDWDDEATVHSARLGIVYRFGGSDPIIPTFDAPAAKPLK
jgi:opacity protein-like surface antigen